MSQTSPKGKFFRLWQKNEQKTATWGLDATIAFSQLFFIVNKWQEDLDIVPYFGSYNTTLFI